MISASRFASAVQVNPLKRRVIRGTFLALGLLIFSAAGVPAAGTAATSPAPSWSIRSIASPTNFQEIDDSSATCASTPQQCDTYRILLANLGSAPSDGTTVTITDTLPAGVTTLSDPIPDSGGGPGSSTPETFWDCSLGADQTVVTCTTSQPLTPLAYETPIEIPVKLASGTTGPLTNQVQVTGGGAPAASTTTVTDVSSATPPFAIHDFTAAALDPAGGLDTQAGDHPAGLTTAFDLPTRFATSFNGVQIFSVESTRQVVVDLPAGLVGNPQAAPRCSLTDLASTGFGDGCPNATRVGTLAVNDSGGIFHDLSVFNIQPERGYPAEFGVYFSAAQRVSLLYATVVGSGADTHVRVTGAPLPEAVQTNGVGFTFYGDPNVKDGNPTSPLAFASNPTNCNAPGFTTTVHVDSWQHPGATHPNGTPDFTDPNWISATADSPPVTGCNALHFNPSISLQPGTTQADSASGLNVDLRVPQTSDPDVLATPPLKDATVTLPQGLSVNPSTADGLAGCSDAQIDLSSNDPPTCPLASQLGTATVTTPLLDHALPGQIFLGTPDCAPCTPADAQNGNLLRLFIVADDPQTGTVLKLPGTVSIDQTTGRLAATFQNNPQFPFDDLKLDFKGGPRGSLTTPQTCGTFTTTSDLKPWSAPDSGPDATPSDSFTTTSGPGGAPCPDPSKFTPAFSAGTLSPLAGSYTPFVLKLSRENGSQRISAIDTTLPEGLLGKLAGIPYCSDAAIAAAAAKSGNAEKSSPSCPLASEVGTVNVGAGSGTPFYVPGHAYLAGPYKGAPLSLAIITPAVAGPFDLGTVVVKTALYVNETTTQIRAVSDPIPSILAGIPLDVRSIALNMNRPNFTLNPTSCDAMQVLGSATSTLGNVAPLQNRFQVGACGALAFKPKLKLSLKGGTKRAQNPALKAVLTARPGDANIGSAQVTLPHSEFLDNAHIRTVCTRVQFAAKACPAASIYGHARAITPLLDQPLEGPVYLRSSSHKLPDLVAALNGQINVVLAGRIDTGKGGGIRNTFEVVPDAPVSKFTLEMQGGKKGLLVNSENICSKPQRATVKLSGQNGASYDTKPLVKASCNAKKKSRGGHRRKGRH